MKKTEWKSPALLFLTAVVWGVAFVAQSVGMDYVGPFTFNCIRCLIGAVVLVPCIWFLDGWKQRSDGASCGRESAGAQTARHAQRISRSARRRVMPAENQPESQVVHQTAVTRCWQVASAVVWHCLWRAICSRSGFSIRQSGRRGLSRRCIS